MATVGDPQRNVSGTAAARTPAVERVDEPLTLPLDALLPDANGEILIVNDAGLSGLTLVTGAVVVESGTAADHMTAHGEDVTGFRFLRFAGGPTLYYPADLDLRIVAPMAAPRKIAGA